LQVEVGSYEEVPLGIFEESEANRKAKRLEIKAYDKMGIYSEGAGINYDRVQFILVEVYTIVEVKSWAGASVGRGRLKSGIGWISLDHVKRI